MNRPLINATYYRSPVGTGTYTRNIMAALPQARLFRGHEYLTKPKTAAFWSKRILEEFTSLIPSVMLHPYWATSMSSRHIIAALDSVQYKDATRFERQMLHASAQHAKAVLVLSEAARSVIGDIVDRPTVLAPPFPDAPWYAEAIAKKLPKQGRIRVAYWGGWHPRKGMLDFLRSLGQSSIAHDVELHCIGAPPMRHNLRVVSYREMKTSHLVKLVDTADLCVYPSGEEGFGLPVFESLLRRRPIISRPLSCYGEFVRGAEGHITLDSIDPESVRCAIVQAVETRLPHRSELLVRPERDESLILLRKALQQSVKDE